ncbi:protoporphyrinogen oxidase [uncultured Ornithinimicrobium sp.]|uniref:protoporphyrinogen oxidase n=1 Tax=uncultured Ornithinimicrobium sp. TaxID=259307 RepID=UPI002592C312|nr:protoporphyrinogen oxidase [uncultured Ornithinimicrobium sp.]
MSDLVVAAFPLTGGPVPDLPTLTPSSGGPDSPSRRTVAVVGGGFTGLLAARQLRAEGADVLLLEASERVGGQIRTVPVAGVPVDVGAEAMHLAAPGTAELLDELDLTESMVTARTGRSWLVTPRGLRPLPAGVGPAGPTRLRPVVRSRVMTVPGMARAGLEPLLVRSGRVPTLEAGEDVSVGDFVAGRFGRQVVERFVDPLLGGLHAGDVRRLSLRACAPALVPAAGSGRSLLVRRRPGAAGRMSFVSWPEGLGRVVDRLVEELGATVRTGSAVTDLAREGRRWRLRTTDGATHVVDGVVLAVGAAVAAELLAPHSPTAAEQLRATRRADVATVLLALPRAAVVDAPALAGTGMLVPSTTGSTLKAATFLSTKWAHLDLDDTVLVRLSAGRADGPHLPSDDEELVERLRADLAGFTGIGADPVQVHVERWPSALPQLTVGHPARLAAAREALADDAPGVELAGSSYDGLGLTSCAASARGAVDRLHDHLTATKSKEPA